MRGLVLWFGVVMFILGRELLFRLLNLFIYTFLLRGTRISESYEVLL